jgi:hypothetical protein
MQVGLGLGLASACAGFAGLQAGICQAYAFVTGNIRGKTAAGLRAGRGGRLGLPENAEARPWDTPRRPMTTAQGAVTVRIFRWIARENRLFVRPPRRHFAELPRPWVSCRRRTSHIDRPLGGVGTHPAKPLKALTKRLFWRY